MSIFAKYYLSAIPHNLNVGAVLARSPIEVDEHKKAPQKVLDKLHYTLGVLFWQYKKQRKDGHISSSDDCVRINAGALSDVVGNKYAKYIQWLIKSGIIESNGSWQKLPNGKGKSTGFRYTEKYREGIRKPVMVYVYNDTIYRNVTKKAICPKTKSKYQHQYNFFKDLDYDDSEAERILNQVYPHKEDQHKREIQIHRLNKIRYAGLDDVPVAPFHTGDTGRLYTPLSHLKSELRAALRYKGKPLVEVDIKSSIPWISTFLLCKEFIESKQSVLPSYCSKLFSSNNSIYSSIDSYIMLSKKEGSSSTNEYKEDVCRYIEDVRTGDIYQLLADLWNEKCGKSYDRHTAKKKFLSALNSPPHFESPYKAIMSSQYPSVVEYFDKINGWFKTRKQKKAARMKGDKVDDYGKSGFAYLTQGLESDFLLNTLSECLEQKYPDMPFFTLHDAIYTTGVYNSTVRKMIEAESVKFFGVKIRLG